MTSIIRSFFKGALTLLVFVAVFSLIHSSQTGAAFLIWDRSNDPIVLIVASCLLLLFLAVKLTVEGILLGAMIGTLYVGFLRGGYLTITGVQLVLYCVVLAMGVGFGATSRHLRIPILCAVGLIGLATGLMERLGLAATVRVGGICLALGVLGGLARTGSDYIRTTHIGAFRSARKNFGPLLAFLALYAGCILLFALIYQVINNTVPNSFVITSDTAPARQPDFAENLTFSLALMVNSSYANYNGIVPTSNSCRTLALGESLLGIVFFAIYLQLLLTHTISPKLQTPIKP